MFEILSCNVIRETEKAFLLDTGEGEFWVPKSVINNPEDLTENAEGVDVEIAVWFCEKEGLI